MTQALRLALLLAFAAVPLLEIGVLIRVGQAIGFWRLATIVITTAVLGTIVIRRVGLSMFKGGLQGIESGRQGLEPLLDGFLQVTAGMLLIFPGLISDAIGVMLLAPPVRHAIISSGMLRTFGPAAVDPESFRAGAHREHGEAKERAGGDGVVIEGEFERLAEKTIKPETGLRRQTGQRRG